MELCNLFKLDGKVAIVTGGGNYIGKACSLMLARAGAAVAVSDLNVEDAIAVASEIKQNGGKAIGMFCDVNKEEDLVGLVEMTAIEFGSINILVNNAGASFGPGNQGNNSSHDSGLRYDMNIFSAWRLSQLCAPHMKRAGYGSIINITSVSSINTSQPNSAFGASKAAIKHWTANLAKDYEPANIRVNAIEPGATRPSSPASVLTSDTEEKLLAHTSIKRIGEVDDIAGAVLYFASPVSKWVSGQFLIVNGGGIQTID